MGKMTDKEANCEKCFHRDVCEKRTCAECGGLCDECEIYHQYDGKPNILNCKDFANADILNQQQAENERLNNELHSKVEYIHELLEIIENKEKEIKRYENLKKAENILDSLEQNAFKRSIYNTIDTIKQLENEIEELRKMVGN